MLFVVGIVIVYGSVLYGFVMSHGQLLALWQPFEILIIVGASHGPKRYSEATMAA